MLFFFFKQKTAYEMRISDWSSDVCSSDLAFAHAPGFRQEVRQFAGIDPRLTRDARLQQFLTTRLERAMQLGDQRQRIRREDFIEARVHRRIDQIGRASWRERVWQYV